MVITLLIVLALIIESVVQVVKRLWKPESRKLAWAEVVAMAVGVGFCCLLQWNLFADYVPVTSAIVWWTCCILTGLASGRGASLLHDIYNLLGGKSIPERYQKLFEVLNSIKTLLVSSEKKQ
jgi:hypothetical protein